MMLIRALVLAFSSVSLPPDPGTLSSADDSDEPHASFQPWRAEKSDFERRFSLEARLGIATPTGGLGIAAEFAFIPRLGLGCGVGTNGYGPEYAGWLRFRPILGRHRAMTFSSGLSSAPFVQNEASAGGLFGWGTAALASMREGPPPADRDWAHAYWLNSDLGYESRRGAFLFRVFAGGAALLNPSAGVVQSSSAREAEPPAPPVSVMIYAGLGVGFSE